MGGIRTDASFFTSIFSRDCQQHSVGYIAHVADGYSWSEERAKGTYRLPASDHLGWWAGVAMALSILLHVIVFFTLDNLKVGFRVREAEEITSTEQVNLRQVDTLPLDAQETPPPEDVVMPPVESAALMDEVDLLDKLPKNAEIDIKPEAIEPEYALKMENPALEGDPEARALEISSSEMSMEMPDLGRMESHLPPAAVGQVTIDPGSVQADDKEMGKFTDDLLKRGANGKSSKGTLDGLTSLDDLIALPPNALLSKKTLLPSDLLFEFNSAEMRESAKVGLMKLALLIDRNPGLYCWIEGHTDLVGSDEFNRELSKRRADAVKNYLVKSMRMNPDKIITQGFGRSVPLVTGGTREEQAPNRRVEIRMRKTPPTAADQPKTAAPAPILKKAAVVEESPAVVAQPEPEPPKAVLVKPKRALPVEESPQKAQPVTPEPQRAQPVEETPRAAPVQEEEEAPRAAPIILDEEL